ncbi:hypothetical protein BH10PAT1_BH10PAT1_5080 [soil metagenome]
MQTFLTMTSLWIISIVLLIYGGYGLKNGKILVLGRGVAKKLNGKWAYVYSICLVVMGGALLIGLMYNAIHCGVFSTC